MSDCLYTADFAVIESRWDSEKNPSVKPIFDLIAHLHLTNGYDAIPYERFISARAFKDTVMYFMNKPTISTLYIACHGSDDGLHAEFGDQISFKMMLYALRSRRCSNNIGVISGIFFGCCSFCTEENVKKLMENDDSLKWVAGYDRPVDWGYSTILDGLFMMEYVRTHMVKQDSRRSSPGVGHYGHRIADMIADVAADVKKNHGGLVRDVGFEVFVRKTRNSPIQRLMSPSG